jgi:hypothetical protein
MDDSDNDIQSSDDEIDSLVPTVLLLATIYSQRRLQISSNRLYTGQEYVDDLLNCGNDIRIHNQLRMKLMTFNMLRDWLVQNTKLDSSRYISIEEKLLIFIYISSSGRSNRAAQERFNRGAQVIS